MPRKPKPAEPEKDERRKYGSGSVVKRPNGRYQAAAYTDDGRWVTKTFDTRRQAEDWLTRTRAKRIEGTLEFVDQRMTTGERLDWWSQTYFSMRTTSTRKSYHWGIKVLAEPLRSIPAARIQAPSTAADRSTPDRGAEEAAGCFGRTSPWLRLPVQGARLP